MHIISRNHFASHPLLARLLELHSPPESIHILGNLPEVTIDKYGKATPRILTVVGSRNHTAYAKDVITMLLSSLSGMPVVIVSGLALGVDGLAHKHALNNNLITIAVPGSGLHKNVLYPRTHASLANEIVRQGGALISELPPNASAAEWTFPSRNRIMAALSDAVLIIEAQEKSGTLITARQALELGRDIGVVPGNIFSENSKGTNALAHEGAYVITSREDLLDLLHLPHQTSMHKAIADVEGDELILMDLLKEPMQKDDLLSVSKMSLQAFLVALSSLEMKGYIQETFGEVRKVV